MESSKINMENREAKFEKLVREFFLLLSEYKDVCVRLRKMESCGTPDSKQGELVKEGYTLRERLIKLVDRICALTNSDKVKLDIAYRLGVVGIKVGPCMARFLFEERKEENIITFEEWMAEFMQRADKHYNEHRDRFERKLDVDVELVGTFEELKDRFCSMLVRYKTIWNFLREKGRWLGPCEQDNRAWDGYLLGKRLRVLAEKMFALTDSDEAKLNIVYNFGFAGIEPGPLVLKFMKEQKQKEKNGGEEK